MNTSLRAKLEAGKSVTGMLRFTGSPMVVEMMAAAGLDFVIIDMEVDLIAGRVAVAARDIAQNVTTSPAPARSETPSRPRCPAPGT